jgi:two-component system, chemotaxis family, sensor kinase CheA
MEVKAEYLAIFSEEAADQLREWEESLLALEKDPADREPLNALFRAVHTLKGSAGFIGFDTLQKLAHALESSLSSVRDGQRRWDETLGSLLFDGLDLARSMIDAFGAGMGQGPASRAAQEVEKLLARLAQAAGSATQPTPRPAAQPAPEPAPQPAPRTAAPLTPRPAAQPAPEPAPQPQPQPQPQPSAAELQTSRLVIRIEGQSREAYLRSCLVKARLDRLGTVLDLTPSPDSLRDSTDPFVYTATVRAAMDAAGLASAISIDQVTLIAGEAPVAAPSAAVEPREAIPAAPGPADQGRDVPAEAPASSSPEAPQAEAHGGARPEEVVRVSVKKLDTLLNLVGELVIHNSGFVTATQLLKDQVGKTHAIFDLEEKTEALSAITRDLQDGIMKARMLPVSNVFNRFRRVVRDLAKASGKSVILDVYGEETEIDKKVIDRIGEPLVHLVRNAVDHGLEPAAERLAAGKPAEGAIRLGAYQEGDHICIEVSDDGRGLDHTAILRKAVEKGLISSDEAPRANVDRVLGFIFLPGFSTARTVSDLSGRGVGMDAVKSAVEEMNGALRVRSTPGAGTTVTISLPLTMAIITAVLVDASGSTYAIPISAVREIVKATGDMLKSVGTRRTLLLRNEVLAMVNLASALKNGRDSERAARAKNGNGRAGAQEAQGEPRDDTRPEAQAPAVHPIVVVDYEGRKIGLEVDGIIGSREVVIKSLSRHYREVEGLIGASILGNGKIALIVDVETMISRHHGSSNAALSDRLSIIQESVRTESHRVSSPRMEEEPEGDEPLDGGQASPSAEPAGTAASAAVLADDPDAAQPIEELAREVAGSRGRMLEDVNNQGAIDASISLSQLTGQEIRVSFPESRLVAIKDVAEIMGGEESTVGGIYIGVRGDLGAGMLLVIPEKNLLVLDDLLHQRPAGTSAELSSVDLSGISEMGNILASCFINAMADAAHLTMHPEVPEISIDMCLPVIDSVLARFNQPGDRLLLTEAVIYGGGSEDVVCHQVLFLEPDSLRTLMNALAGTPSPAAGG